jgi:hypothetical protein
VGQVKEFCSSLLDDCQTVPRLAASAHPWARPLSGLKMHRIVEIAGSLFLFRKTLPSDPPDVESWFDRMTSTEDRPLDPKFLEHIDRSIDRMFPFGFDGKLFERASSATLPFSSSLDAPRSRGGLRGAFLRGESVFRGREEFISSVLGRYTRPLGKSYPVRMALAQCQGKRRIVTVGPQEGALLSPLHETIYDRLSTFPWLLRGEALPKSFSEFTLRKDEVFVSGDYESATDNLDTRVQMRILDRILSKCRWVSVGLARLARDSLQCRITSIDPQSGAPRWGNGVRDQKRGQLMGNYLSFPLLCLTNYLAFTYAIPREGVPRKINGDDIVFRSTRAEASRWMDVVSSAGLKLSVGKTAVSRCWFSLNSTFFRPRAKKVSLIPVLRSSHLFRGVEVTGIASRVKEVGKGMRTWWRRYWQALLLRRIAPAICRTQRSLRNLGVWVHPWVLRRSLMLEREVFYTSLPEPRLPTVSVGWRQEVVPDGWERQRGSVQDPDFFREIVDLAWIRPAFQSYGDDSWDLFREGTMNSVSWLSGIKRRLRLLRASRKGLHRWMVGRLDDDYRRRVRGGSVWVRAPTRMLSGSEPPEVVDQGRALVAMTDDLSLLWRRSVESGAFMVKLETMGPLPLRWLASRLAKRTIVECL